MGERKDQVSDARRAALAALAAAGEHPAMNAFPQGAVFIWDHDLRYLSAGGYGLAEVGFSREMLEGRTIFEVYPPEITSVLEPPYRAALGGQSPVFDLPFNGHIYSQHLAPVRDGEGAVVAGIGFAQDVTQARAAEQALRASEQRARLTFEHAPIGKALVELDGRWRQVNAAVTKLTGYSKDELLGMTFQDITHPDDLAADLADRDRLLRGEIDSYQIEKRYFTADGSTVWVLLAVSLVRGDDGRPLYFIAQIQDITQLKGQQQALEDLSAMLAHDLRSPLTSLTGFAELLESGWADFSAPQRTNLISRILATARAMDRLLGEALTVSAVHARVVTPSPSSVRVDDVVSNALDLVTGLDGTVDLTEMQPVVAWVDPVHLTQVITNLLSNAAKYGGRLRISSGRDDDTTWIRIADNGPGVPPEFVPHLFERFTRADGERTSTKPGAGLGLYITKNLLQVNHGAVSYSDTPGGGATFTLTLPGTASTTVAE